jgi:NADH-quinone oxidoreductase subunit E
MSVRRLADAAIQPAAFAFNKANSLWAKAAIKKYPKGREQSAVIPLMMRAQEQEGWVTKAAIEHIADMLEMPRIRALEVATFYTQFQLKPVGTKAHVQVCGTTPCMLRGSEDLMAVCKSKIHHDQFHTNAAGTLSWEEVECLGACVNAPMVMIFNDTYEDLTPKRLEEIIDAFEAGKGQSVTPGPQIDRAYSAPVSGLTSLIDKPTASKAKEQATGAQTPAAATMASNAALPKTAAIETSAAIKGPKNAPVLAANDAKASVETSPKIRDTSVRGLTVKSKATGGGKQRDPAHAAISKPEDSAAIAKKTTVKAQPAKLAGEQQPELFKKPRSGKADDLSLIWGVGPKLEKMLNNMGIWHFDQIAAWGKAELAWVDERITGFKGRASRDEWVKQSKKLAKGWRPDSTVGEKPV